MIGGANDQMKGMEKDTDKLEDIILDSKEAKMHQAEINDKLKDLVDHDEEEEESDRDIGCQAREEHGYESDGEHSHVGPDPRSWSDPELYFEQARRVHGVLAAAAPSLLADLDRNLASLDAELSQLAQDEAEAWTSLTDVSRLAQTGPWVNYPARRYDFVAESFELDPQSPPPAERAAKVATWAEAGGRAILVWSQAPSAEVTDALPAAVEHVVLDALEQPVDGDYDYLARATTNVEMLRALVGATERAEAE